MKTDTPESDVFGAEMHNKYNYVEAAWWNELRRLERERDAAKLSRDDFERMAGAAMLFFASHADDPCALPMVNQFSLADALEKSLDTP